MKLSEAIRLGAMMGPQARGWTYNPHTQGTCALGAGVLAVVPDVNMCRLSKASKLWPWLIDRKYLPPSAWFFVDVVGYIVYLNDTLEWTREQIADWVESVEPEEKAQTSSNVEVPQEVCA